MTNSERKLRKYLVKAEACTSRDEARKILKKHAKARAKLLTKRIIDND